MYFYISELHIQNKGYIVIDISDIQKYSRIYESREGGRDAEGHYRHALQGQRRAQD